MHDLETIKRMNQGAGHAPKVASDGRVCTDYHSRPVKPVGRFYTTQEFTDWRCGGRVGFVHDSIELQGYGSFGPMALEDAERLCDLLNALTKV